MAARLSLTWLLYSAPCINSDNVIAEMVMRLAFALKMASTSTGSSCKTYMTELVPSR